ncbi:MAG: ABC transporter ATP-binding protein [Chloroflexi bacterium]|nr:ABC transporter ATP-binding protein [Chloroflexota bacterium]
MSSRQATSGQWPYPRAGVSNVQTPPGTPIIQVEGLRVAFFSREGVVKAVNGITFSLRENSILAMVGESGSGKTVTALSILGLVPYPGRIMEGRVLFNGVDLVTMHPEALRRVRGKEIGMVFQDPMSSLNPSIAIGIQVEEVLLAHTDATRQEARIWAQELLTEMGLPDSSRLLKQYPFQLSGGMRQRVMLSIAMALRPKVLIADEPTSNLDTTLQAAILSQLRKLKQEHGTAILLITHDMGVVAQMADQVAVMYAGSIVEHAATANIFQRPAHPYTWGLLQSIPRLDDASRKLRPMGGRPPDLINLPDECPFLPRCFKASTLCRASPRPALRPLQEGHVVACFNEIKHE